MSKRVERDSKYSELTKLGDLTPSVPDSNYKDFLVEAYKKHSTELASIEDRLNKFLLIILGVFAVGAKEIPRPGLTPVPAWILVLVVLGFAGFGLHYNFEMRNLRKAVRYLLVRCEIDMGFYTPKDGSKDLKKANRQLYTEDELAYPTKGKYLGWTYAAAIIAAALGLISLTYLGCPTMFRVCLRHIAR